MLDEKEEKKEKIRNDMKNSIKYLFIIGLIPLMTQCMIFGHPYLREAKGKEKKYVEKIAEKYGTEIMLYNRSNLPTMEYEDEGKERYQYLAINIYDKLLGKDICDIDTLLLKETVKNICIDITKYPSKYNHYGGIIVSIRKREKNTIKHLYSCWWEMELDYLSKKIIDFYEEDPTISMPTPNWKGWDKEKKD